MNSEGMYVEALIDNTVFTRALCDTGCSAVALVSERFAQRKKLYMFAISPKPIHQVCEEKKEPIQVNHVARFDLDIGGWMEPTFGYVVPGQTEDLILGLRWLERQNAVLLPAEQLIKLQRPRITVSTKPVTPHADAYEIGGVAYMANITRARKRNLSIEVFSASLKDIQKALRYAHTSEPDPQEPPNPPNVPDWLKPVKSAFDRKKADELPPYRPGIDHAINLQKNLDGTDKTIPSSPLYRQSKEELLVLRKTITELLDKGFIRASNSPVASPVLFVKKPGGGLRFCVDYRKLNSVSQKDRYPLPLINETLRMIAQARWVSKVDVISAFHRIRMRMGDEWMTAFMTRLGSYEWLVCPFGLMGGPATF